METRELSFDLVADDSGKVLASHDEVPPVSVTLNQIVAQSTLGCNNRDHAVTASLAGGVTFNFTGTMTDCTNLVVQLGDLSAPALTTTTLSLEVDGYTPGENVHLDGTLYYSIDLF